MLAAALEGKSVKVPPMSTARRAVMLRALPLPARLLGWAKKLSFTELSSKRGSWDGIA